MPSQLDHETEWLELLYAAAGEPERWQEFLLRLTRHMDRPMAAFLSMDADSEQSSTLLHDTNHVELMEMLAPHLKRALHLHRKILDLKHAAAAAGCVVDALDVASAGVDGEGKICFMNGMAEALLLSEEILCIRDQRIAARDSQQTAALDKLVQTAADLHANSESGGSLTVWNGDHSLYVTALACGESDLLFPDSSRVLVTITDPNARPRSRARLLSRLFGLTSAETRVAMLLVDGLEPNEIGERTRTTSHTVRSHLKSIYEKTNVARQSQLIRLISTLPGQL
jgi:DNA-binding CsgD family transcriptional regulator